MPEIVIASLHNVVYVLRMAAASLFGYAVSQKSIALSDGKECTLRYLLSK